MVVREGSRAMDLYGPWFFKERCADMHLELVVGPAMNGSRPPLALQPVVEQMLSGLGGKTDWTGRIGSRVLPPTVSLIDDPGAKDYHGAPLLGGVGVGDEGVPAQKGTVMAHGHFK